MCSMDFSGAWGVDLSMHRKLYIHHVRKGACWLVPFTSSNPIKMEAGDYAITTGNVGHALAKSPESKFLPLEDALKTTTDDIDAELSCCYFSRNCREKIPLIDWLPQVIHISKDQLVHRQEIQLLMDILEREKDNPTSSRETVTSRLIEALYVYLLRAWEDSPEGKAVKKHAVVSDLQIAQALSTIHSQYDQSWTVESLATKSSMSRAAFSRRFSELVGASPIAYLTKYRMQNAAQMLGTDSNTLIEIAQKIGYEDEFSFSKAFKRIKGVSPGHYLGLTEAFRSTYLSPDEVDTRPTSMGKAIPETEVFVVNASGERCAPGETGILVHRGPTVSLGYWGRPEDTARVIRKNPLVQDNEGGDLICYSGDLVRMDQVDYLVFVGCEDGMSK